MLVQAQPDGDQSVGDEPWRRGASAERQQAATALFERGLALQEDLLFVEAKSRYQEALAMWDHPSIHFQLAVLHEKLQQPLQAHASLQQALVWGDEALDAARRAEADRLMAKLMHNELALVEIHCQEPEAEIKLNGQAAVHRARSIHRHGAAQHLRGNSQQTGPLSSACNRDLARWQASE